MCRGAHAKKSQHKANKWTKPAWREMTKTCRSIFVFLSAQARNFTIYFVKNSGDILMETKTHRSTTRNSEARRNYHFCQHMCTSKWYNPSIYLSSCKGLFVIVPLVFPICVNYSSGILMYRLYLFSSNLSGKYVLKSSLDQNRLGPLYSLTLN